MTAQLAPVESQRSTATPGSAAGSHSNHPASAEHSSLDRRSRQRRSDVVHRCGRSLRIRRHGDERLGLRYVSWARCQVGAVTVEDLVIVLVVGQDAVHRDVHHGNDAAVDVACLTEQIRGVEVETRRHSHHEVISRRQRLRQLTEPAGTPQIEVRRRRAAAEVGGHRVHGHRRGAPVRHLDRPAVVARLAVVRAVGQAALGRLPDEDRVGRTLPWRETRRTVRISQVDGHPGGGQTARSDGEVVEVQELIPSRGAVPPHLQRVGARRQRRRQRHRRPRAPTRGRGEHLIRHPHRPVQLHRATRRPVPRRNATPDSSNPPPRTRTSRTRPEHPNNRHTADSAPPATPSRSANLSPKPPPQSPDSPPRQRSSP